MYEIDDSLFLFLDYFDKPDFKEIFSYGINMQYHFLNREGNQIKKQKYTIDVPIGTVRHFNMMRLPYRILRNINRTDNADRRRYEGSNSYITRTILNYRPALRLPAENRVRSLGDLEQSEISARNELRVRYSSHQNINRPINQFINQNRGNLQLQNSMGPNQNSSNIHRYVTHFELREMEIRLEKRLDDKITELKTEFNGQIAELKTEMRAFKTEIRNEMRNEMRAFKTEITNEMRNQMRIFRTEMMKEIRDILRENREGH